MNVLCFAGAVKQPQRSQWRQAGPTGRHVPAGKGFGIFRLLHGVLSLCSGQNNQTGFPSGNLLHGMMQHGVRHDTAKAGNSASCVGQIQFIGHASRRVGNTVIGKKRRGHQQVGLL
ncbi:MAG: hypothetical protein BWX55_01084 [Deltaproteobacteria bacterium ADurb.Bin022]|nr:MAG: hypothetical protein BWX55_01084 [Deltaproteobacteria bacterium ADurb.Bin022]